MSPQTLQDPTSHPGPVQRLSRAAVAVAAGAVLSKRSRVGGALLLAGLAWLAIRRGKSAGESAPQPLPPAPNKINDLPDPESVEGLCAPSNPFLDDQEEFNEPKWDDLLTALMPPPSLFSPPEQPAAPRHPSPMLQAAPTFVEIEEVSAPPLFQTGATLPDSIAIPTTPDPPLGLLANSLPPPPPVQTSITAPPTEVLSPLLPAPTIQPKAGLPPKVESPKPTEPLADPSPPKRKSFLDWLRE